MTSPTLAELKAAIEAVPPHPGPCIPGQNVDQWVALLHEHRFSALDVWRTAFEWHVGLVERYAEFDDQGHITDALALDRECNEGMRLIREHLR